MASPFSVSAAPTVVTIGVGGTYATVSDAILNGAVSDGDVLSFVSDVTESDTVAIKWNVTIDGNGFTWKINPPTSNVHGIYLIDTSLHPSNITVRNMTVTTDSLISSMVFSNASALHMRDVIIKVSPSLTTGYQTAFEYNPMGTGHKWLFLTNVVVYNASSTDISLMFNDIVTGHIQMDNVQIYDTNPPNGVVGLNVLTMDYSRIVLTGHSLFSRYVPGAFQFMAYDQSTLNAYLFNLTSHSASKHGVYVGSTASGSVNVQIYGARIIAPGNIIYILSSGQSSNVYIENLYTNYAGGYGIYARYTKGMHKLTVNDFWVNRVSRDGIHIYTASTDLLRIDMTDIYMQYIWWDGIDYNDYDTREAYVNFNNITLYDSDETLDLYLSGLGYTLFRVDGLYVDDTSWDAVDLYCSKEVFDLYLLNTYFYHVDDDLIDGYVEDSTFNMYIDNLEVDWHTEDEGIDLYTYNASGIMDIRNFYLDETEDDNIRILNDYPRDIDIFIYNAYLPDYHGLHITSYNYPNVSFYAAYSYIRSIYMYNVDGEFHETYFNEAFAPLYNSDIDVSWTYNVWITSNITNLPVKNAKVVLKMENRVLDMGYTNEFGIVNVLASYSIDNAFRGVNNLEIEVTYGGETYYFNYRSAYASPGWYRTFHLEIPVKSVSIKIKGTSELGIAMLNFDDKGGTLTVTYLLDPLNPDNNRVVSYDIIVDSIIVEGSYVFIDIRVNLSANGSSNWLPTKIIIDTATERVFVFGPIMFMANY